MHFGELKSPTGT